MSRSRFTVSILALLLVFLESLVVVALGYNVIPHVNPNEIPEETSTLYILLVYSKAINALAKLDFKNTSSMIRVVYESFIPENLRYIVLRVNELLNSTSSDIKLAKKSLDNATLLYSIGLLEKALVEVDRCIWFIGRANITLNKLENAINELIQRLPVSPFIAHLVSKERSNIQSGLRSLRGTLSKLLSEALKLRSIVKEVNYTKLIETRISVCVEPGRALLGSTVKIYGRLTIFNGTPLNGRVVKLFINGTLAGLSRTDGQGFYVFYYKVPFIYRDYLRVGVAYTPTGNDTKYFTPCFNETLVYLVYNKTCIKLYTPSTVYPSIPFTVSFRVYPSTRRFFKVYLNDKIIVKDYTDDTGFYKFNLSVDVSRRVHIVRVVVPPRGLLGPASTMKVLTIIFKRLNVDINLPEVVFNPIPFTITGRVYSDTGGLYNASITVVYCGRIFNTTTSVNGVFEVVVSGFSSIPLGYSDIHVHVKPVEVWFERKHLVLRVFTVNIASLSILTVSLGILVYLTYFRVVSRRRGKRLETISTTSSGIARSSVGESISGVLRGIRDTVITEFYSLVMVIGRVLGVRLEESDTLREFIFKLRGRVSERVYRLLFEIIVAVERHLYSPFKIAGDALERFKRIVREVVYALTRR